jgi:hypothetical protein
MLIDGIWMVSFHELFQFLSDTVRLSHQPLAFLFALLRCYLHLVTATDGVLIVDDELLVLADAILIACPDVALQLWVPLIVTLPITGTTPWCPPRDTQSRGPSLLLASVHVEQY